MDKRLTDSCSEPVLPEITLSKKDYRLREDIIFLNHGSFGACPKALLEEQRRWQDLLEDQPVLFFRELNDRMRTARVKFG